MRRIKVDALGCSVKDCKFIFTQPMSDKNVEEEAVRFGWVLMIVVVGDSNTPTGIAICPACREKFTKVVTR